MSLSGLTSIPSPGTPAAGARWLRPENRRRCDDREAQPVSAGSPRSPVCQRSEGFAEDLPEETALLPGR